jgi:hypothetical protein
VKSGDGLGGETDGSGAVHASTYQRGLLRKAGRFVVRARGLNAEKCQRVFRTFLSARRARTLRGGHVRGVVVSCERQVRGAVARWDVRGLGGREKRDGDEHTDAVLAERREASKRFAGMEILGGKRKWARLRSTRPSFIFASASTRFSIRPFGLPSPGHTTNTRASLSTRRPAPCSRSARHVQKSSLRCVLPTHRALGAALVDQAGRSVVCRVPVSFEGAIALHAHLVQWRPSATGIQPTHSHIASQATPAQRLPQCRPRTPIP